MSPARPGTAAPGRPDALPGLTAEMGGVLHGLGESCREDLASWFASTLSPSLAHCRSSLDDQLFTLLDTEAGRSGRDDPEAFEQGLRNQAREILERGRAEALQGIGREAQAWVQLRGLRAVGALVDHLDDAPGGGSVETPRSRLLAALRQGTWTWEPPGLARLTARDWRPSFRAPEPEYLRLLPPGRWGRRRIAARVRSELTGAVQGLLADLEHLTRQYLDACLESMEGALELFLRQAIEAAQGEDPMRAAELQPADVPEAGGCVVCAEVWEALHGFFCQWQGEWERDPAARAAFLEGPGFCPGHLWMLEPFASPRGLCRGLQPLLRLLSKSIAAWGASGAELDLLPEPPTMVQRCAACQAQEQATRSSVERWAQDLSRGGTPPGLCLQHLPRVLARSAPAVHARLARNAANRLDRMARAMTGFSLKSDALRRDLLTEMERQAHREALEFLAGYRALGMGRGGKEA